jgi:hypothetical protein
MLYDHSQKWPIPLYFQILTGWSFGHEGFMTDSKGLNPAEKCRNAQRHIGGKR